MTKRRVNQKSKPKTIPFAKGFQRATPEEIRHAIDCSDKCYDPDLKRPSTQKGFYTEIPQPTHIDDWLAQYVEDPDTVDEWLKLRKRICPEIYLKKDICLIWIEREGTKSEKKKIMTHLKRFVECFYYGINVRLLDTLSIREEDGQYYIETNGKRFNITSRRCHPYDEEKALEDEIQFRAADVISPINSLRKQLKGEVSCLCGVTMEDLYIGKSDSFTCGLAAGGDNVGVFSMCRYNPLFRSEEDEELEMKDVEWEEDEVIDCERLDSNDLIVLERCCKIVAHEIGHMNQIGHCVCRYLST